ncbi:MAG TPA: glycoside hydrolase domain-containing protein, partial [Aequorivita sp.]|nr:glycoside hydrolase domain-containing protein [Aequorivita sp.]
VAPGTDEYVLGSPLFKKITLKLENGKTFTISAPNNTSETRYIEEAALNGNSYSKNFLKYNTVMEGGNLSFKMSVEPNKKRGTGTSDAPYSMSNEL